MKATRVKGGEVWRNKMSKKIRSVVWLVNLMNIKSIQKLLFGLNVDKRHGDKRGKERFCILSQNLKSQKIFSRMKKNLLKRNQFIKQAYCASLKLTIAVITKHTLKHHTQGYLLHPDCHSRRQNFASLLHQAILTFESKSFRGFGMTYKGSDT